MAGLGLWPAAPARRAHGKLRLRTTEPSNALLSVDTRRGGRHEATGLPGLGGLQSVAAHVAREVVDLAAYIAGETAESSPEVCSKMRLSTRGLMCRANDS